MILILMELILIGMVFRYKEGIVLTKEESQSILDSTEYRSKTFLTTDRSVSKWGKE
jgi:hypothetical protein